MFFLDCVPCPKWSLLGRLRSRTGRAFFVEKSTSLNILRNHKGEHPRQETGKVNSIVS